MLRGNHWLLERQRLRKIETHNHAKLLGTMIAMSAIVLVFLYLWWGHS